MSRVGRMPIGVPPQVRIEIEGAHVTVKGPKGELARDLPAEMQIQIEGDQVLVTRPSDEPQHRAMHGLTRTLLANMVTGVDTGFTKTLELHGVGYRAQQQGESVVLSVGFSHTVEKSPPPGVTFEVDGTNRIHVRGIDKELVGQAAAEVRAVRPPEPYKGKGIRYAGERVRRKAGKAGKVH
jgi:large subunit ribosomal protein L6